MLISSCCVFAGNWVAYAKYNAYATYDICIPSVCECVCVCVCATLTWHSLSRIHFVHQFHKFGFDKINVRYDYTRLMHFTLHNTIKNKKRKENLFLMSFFLCICLCIFMCYVNKTQQIINKQNKQYKLKIISNNRLIDCRLQMKSRRWRYLYHITIIIMAARKYVEIPWKIWISISNLMLIRFSQHQIKPQQQQEQQEMPQQQQQHQLVCGCVFTKQAKFVVIVTIGLCLCPLCVCVSVFVFLCLCSVSLHVVVAPTQHTEQ